MGTQDDVRDFTQVWDRDGPRVAAYARRHVLAAEVQDVVAETFLHAWRRWDDVPAPPLPWLIGAARKIIGNHRRGMDRRRTLEQRLFLLGEVAATADDAALLATERMDALAALAALNDDQREALLLVAWDGLSPDQAATVLGMRSGAFRVRLHRARAAAQHQIDRMQTNTFSALYPSAATEGSS